jgi:hypothetical protein
MIAAIPGLFVALLLSGTSSPVRDDAAVLKAALSHLCPGNYLIVQSTSAKPSEVERSRLGRFPTAALEDLWARNRASETLPLDNVCAGARMATRSEINTTFDKSRSTATDLNSLWKSFYEDFPGAWGLVRMSLPGYSPNGRLAVVYLETGRGGLAGEGSYLLLKKNKTKWRVVIRDSVWVA